MFLGFSMEFTTGLKGFLWQLFVNAFWVNSHTGGSRVSMEILCLSKLHGGFFLEGFSFFSSVRTWAILFIPLKPI